MLLKVHSASLTGLRAQILDIEVDISNSHKFHYQVVGLPDTAVRESGDRVRAATRNCGYQFPPCGAVTVNLAPADFKKEGSGYDLPIALAILGITGEITAEAVQPWLIMGELSLDGRVCPIRGALPVAMSARKAGFKKLLLPADNAREAGVVEGLDVFPAHSLPQVVHLLNGGDAEPVRVLREELYRASDRPLPNLRVLDADIDDVWPSHLDQEEVVTGRKQLLRMQEFRLNEVLAIGRAKGGLVVSKTEKSVRVHLTSQVSETMTDRILYYLEDNRLFRPGLWFSEREGDVSFLLYLRADQVPKQLDLMIRHYLVIWAAFFESSVTSETPDQS